MTSHEPSASTIQTTGATEPIDLLVVGTFGGGGIHHYIDEQVARFSAGVTPRTYDMVAAPDGDGPAWFLRSLSSSLGAAARFPTQPEPDLVHVHTSHRFSFYRASLYVLYARAMWDCPIVVHVHGSSFDEFVETDELAVRGLQDVVFAAADRIVVLSEYWREVLADRVPDQKLRVFPNAVDPDDYDPDYGADPPRIVFVSNLYERKGVDTLVESLEALAAADVTFEADVAGSGPLVDTVEELVGRRDRVTYHGYVSEAEKRALLNRASIYVLPTHAEGLPIAMLEGMAGGNAVVSTRVGSIPEVIGEDNGLLIDPGDAPALTDALESLVTDPERVERMGRHNRRLVETEYNWDRVIEEFESLYGELCR